METELLNLDGPQTAAALKARLERIVQSEADGEKTNAEVGELLWITAEKKYWRQLGEYKNFDEYLKSLASLYRRGRTQLYYYFSTVKALRARGVTNDEINQMGISKAIVLYKAMLSHEALKGFSEPQTVPEVIVHTALNPAVTKADLNKAVAEKLELMELEKDASWYDLGGFPATKEEKLVLDSAWEAAMRTDPVIQDNKRTPSAVTRQVILRFAMEYLNSHPEEVK